MQAVTEDTAEFEGECFLKSRLITAGIGIVFAVTVLIFAEMNSWVAVVVISLISSLMCYEYLSSKGLEKNIIFLIPSCAFGFLSPLLSFTFLRFLPLFVYFVAVTAVFLAKHKTLDLGDAFFALAGTFIITMPMTIFASSTCGDNYHTAFRIVLVLATPWLSDSGAYFVGRSLGKRKLCPSISPNKTVEGAAGGLLAGGISAVIVGLVFLLLYRGDAGFHPNFLILAILGMVVSVTSILGDLFFSLIKRYTGIKDYGSILPGHGGMLDRFDSVLFCIPFTAFMLQFIYF